jgi:hypothetical protein
MLSAPDAVAGEQVPDLLQAADFFVNRYKDF